MNNQNDLNNTDFFPPYNPEPFTLESRFDTLEWVLEQAYKRLKSNKFHGSLKEDDGEDINIETDPAAREAGGLFMAMNGISAYINELFWQVQARYRTLKLNACSSDEEKQKEQGIKAKQYIIGAIMHAGLTPMGDLLNLSDKVSALRITALDKGDTSYLATFRNAKGLMLLPDFSEKLSKTIRIGFLSGFDKHRWMDIHESYGWNSNDIANMLLIYGIACSTSLLPWDKCVKQAREQILDFRSWYQKNY